MIENFCAGRRRGSVDNLEKELVEKLAKASWDAIRKFGDGEWPHDSRRQPYCQSTYREVEVLLPTIRSHTQALVAAAFASCAKTCLGNVLSEEQMNGEPNLHVGEMCLRLCHERDAAAIRKLTPADAARELERRELEKVIEGLKMARARTLPGCRTLVNLGHVPEAVRAGEWVQMDIEGEIADVEQRLASLSKPAPVERSNADG